MNRLSIVDIKNGKQPFFSQDKKHCIILNGEIVNSLELKKTFFDENYQKFITKNSDTELLLNLLIKKGESCLPDLNGMFAFCYFDIQKKKIIIARDRFGIKPLYYFLKNNIFCFSSELETLLSLYKNNLRISHQSLYDYLSLMYIPSPQTIYEDIFKLKPGEKIIIDLTKKDLKKKIWHEHKFKPDYKLNFHETKKELYRLTEKAVMDWTQSDVPICNSLSGGLDSSVISSILGSKNFPLSNYTIGFLNSTDQTFDETYLAKQISKRWSQRHYIKKINPINIIDDLDNILSSLHEPYGGGIPSWVVYKYISLNYKVVFNGTGIDEFFGNYSKWKSLKTFFPKKISFSNFEKNFFNKRYYASAPEKQNITNLNTCKLENTAEKFFKIYNDSSSDDLINNSALLDIKTQLSDEFLQVLDNFSMRHSLEARPPYLDKNLTDFLFSIPSNIRIASHQNVKKLFKDTFKNILNKEVINSKKKGFILPVENWLKNEMKTLLEKYLSKKKLNEHGFFREDIWNTLVNPFLKRNKFFSKFDKFHRKQTIIWGVLFFQLWYEKHINKKSIQL